MLVKGRKEDCDKWLAKMKSYDEPNHFFRIFDATVIEEYEENGGHCMRISGDCAWSLYSCCIDGYPTVDLFTENTRELHLKMEVYSSEPGMCFQEHYIYEYGECLANESRDYTEYYWDRREYPDFEEYRREEDIPDDVKESDFNEEICSVGGFPVWDFSI